MRYSRKMFLLFAAMGILIASILFGFYYNYKVTVYEKEEYGMLAKQAEQIGHRLDTAVEQMEFAVSFLLSDKDVLEGLEALSGKYGQPGGNYEAAEAIRNIRIVLGAWYLNRNFYNVIVFNQAGIALTDAGKLNEAEVEEIVSKGNYKDLTQGKKGGRALRGRHPVSWDSTGTPAISLVQEVKGFNGSFIEVEYDYEKLGLPLDSCFLVTDKEGGQLINQKKEGLSKELESTFVSQSTGISVAVMADGQEIRKRIIVSTLPDFLLILLFILAILVFVQFTSRYLTSPILELSNLLEHRDIRNLGEPFCFHSDIKEVDSLGNSFKRLLERLNQSVKLEKRAVKLQMQAQFDALQAGVDPHFIYNVLNVIANRGMIAQDDTICRICSRLGSILRYSTNTKERNAAVAEELQYLKNYFYLIQERFQERFSYECRIDSALMDKTIPKLGLQQLAENCVKHGFSKNVLKITI